MQWTKMTKSQQSYARRLAEKTGLTVTASQCAKHLDDFAAWDRGQITAAELEARTGHNVKASQ